MDINSASIAWMPGQLKLLSCKAKRQWRWFKPWTWFSRTWKVNYVFESKQPFEFQPEPAPIRKAFEIREGIDKGGRNPAPPKASRPPDPVGHCG